MTGPDYPLLTPGGYEMYQLAQIATFIAERLAAHRRSPAGLRGRAHRAAAVRDLAAAATALDTLLDSDEPLRLPRPLDPATYARAERLVAGGPRAAHVVHVPDTGWAVVGTVPGVGPVGASVPTETMAQAVQAHLLTAPLEDVAAWAVTDGPTRTPTLPDQVDVAAFVERLDPERDRDRAVATALRGHGRGADAAIRGRFPDPAGAPQAAGIAPDAASTPGPGTPPSSAPAVPAPAAPDGSAAPATPAATKPVPTSPPRPRTATNGAHAAPPQARSRQPEQGGPALG